MNDSVKEINKEFVGTHKAHVYRVIVTTVILVLVDVGIVNQCCPAKNKIKEHQPGE